MNSTKKRILETSLNLFNEFGITGITQRSIAVKMKISLGNLTYHYKKKINIETALYFELVAEIDNIISNLDLKTINLNAMIKLTDSTLKLFYKYRFIMLDFVHVMRKNKIIKDHSKELLKIRQQQILGFVEVLKRNKILRTEELDNEYENLFIRFQILSDFWLSSIEVTEGGVSLKSLKKYKLIILESIYPYLTQKGKKEYLSITQ